MEPRLNTWSGPAPTGKPLRPEPAIKALMGWAGLLVWDDSVDLPDLVRAFLDQARKESCGQCFPCRLGTEQLGRIMERICAGQGREEDLDRLAWLVRRVSDTARCGVGQGLAKPVLEALDLGREAFLQAVRDKKPRPRGQYAAEVTAPCRNACPSHVDVPAYLEEIRLERYGQGLAKVRQDCPLPGTIGRVCVRPCEGSCRRSRVDAPLAIKALKRFLADQELAGETGPDFRPAEPRSERVAIVGAGPAGLSCAFYLGLKGYRTTVFEAQEGPGGMAAYGIPAYRLPRDVLGHEVSLVESVGAEIRYGVKVGRDVSLEDLTRQGFKAVFVAVGAPESSRLRCEGEDAGYQCFLTGIDFLAQAARGQRPVEGRKLLVVGGGNVAMDCVRTALRLGFGDVNLLYRRTGTEMPADAEEIEEAREEGVKFHYLVAPVKVLARDGKVVGLECQRMELGQPDASGRRSPVPVPGSNFVIDCDVVIPAVGQVCVVDCVLPEAASSRKTLVVDQTTFQSSQPHVFGGGDCVTGPATLIGALAAGKKAARFIAQYLEEGTCRPGPREDLDRLVQALGVFDPNESFPYRGSDGQSHPPARPPEERIKDFEEVSGGLSEAEARAEAARCLRCYRIAVAAV